MKPWAHSSRLDCWALVPSRKSRLKYMLRVSKVAELSSKNAAWLNGEKPARAAALASAVWLKRERRAGAIAWVCRDCMDDLLRLLFLFVENASRRFSYRCVAAATAVETVRGWTVTG